MNSMLYSHQGRSQGFELNRVSEERSGLVCTEAYKQAGTTVSEKRTVGPERTM